jgi:hypothetical protein
VNLGLKPYDLVWVEGKSAAWRYPSEVDLLKSYAPATEEQPYDRFYKKAEERTEEKQAGQVITEPAEERQPDKVASKPVEEKHSENMLNKPMTERKKETPVVPVENKIPVSKKVFVSMPENGAVRRSTPVAATTAPVVEPKPVTRKEKIEEKSWKPNHCSLLKKHISQS